MLDFPMIDAHVHLWDPAALRYPWLDDIPLLNKPHLPDDFHGASAGTEVGGMVFVQCECLPSQALDEVRWVNTLAQTDLAILGIVAYAPLENGEAARADLEALKYFKLVKGVRRIIQFEEDMEFCLRPDFIKGVRMLPEFGYTFDLCVSHAQMPNMIRFVAQCPGVRFMLDHIGKPDIKGGLTEPWKSDLRRLASIPDVFCKISGLVTEADHSKWNDDDLRPYIDHVIESFGFGRVAFGGDWPVARLATDYPRWVNALIDLAGTRRESDLRRLFRDNAIDFYGLAEEGVK